MTKHESSLCAPSAEPSSAPSGFLPSSSFLFGERRGLSVAIAAALGEVVAVVAMVVAGDERG